MDAYIYQADLCCEECALTTRIALNVKRPDLKAAFDAGNADSDSYPAGPYMNGGGEADLPQHCGDCGEFLMNPLTDAGEAFVIETLGYFLKEGDEELGASFLANELSERIDAASELNEDLRERYKQWVEHYDYVFETEAEKRFNSLPSPG